MPRTMTAACRISSFAFYDRMVIFDQINKTVLVVAHVPHRRAATCGPNTIAPAGASTRLCRQLEGTNGPPAARRHSVLGEPQSNWKSNFPQANSSAPSKNARNTFAPATFFRSCSASG